MRRGVVLLWLAAALTCAVPARAELIEDIVAWVNGEIITKSDYEEEEQTMIAEAQRRYAGKELEEQLERIRGSLLLQMIDRKILVGQASRLFDMKKMEQTIYEDFKKQQNVTDDDELARLLAKEGFTVPNFKRRLVEMFAPEEVVRFEMKAKMGVGDREVEAYYREHQDEFAERARVTFRELVLLAETQARKESRQVEAQAIRQRAVAGEDFAELARQLSEAGSKDSGGVVGPIEREDLAPEIASVVFTIPVGEVSEVVTSPHGLHLLKVDSRNERRIRPLEEVQAQARKQIEGQRYQNELLTFLEKSRAEAEWCVKPRYRHLLGSRSAPGECADL